MRGIEIRATAACLALLLAPALAVGADDPPGGDTTRAAMDPIFESIRFVLPLSLDDDRFQDPERRAEILAALNSLAENGAKLEDHGHSLDASFGYLSRSLARDTAEVRDRYVGGRFAEARFLLLQITDDCVACHSRLPSDRKFPMGEQFVTREAILALPLDERAKLEMATRQFDRAIATHEALFASPGVSPATLDLHGHFDDYLELCIRVRGDFERPVAAFETFLERDDLHASLRTNMTRWLAELRSLRERPPKGPPREQARTLIRAAESEERYPNDRSALVLYVTASSILHRHVAAAGKPRADAGEAYYLLGLIESRIGRSFWLSQTEHFLETAIRLDPSQPYAADAYELLEEFVVSGYTGSSGSHVPDDVQQRLDELRALVDESAEPSAAPASGANSTRRSR